MAADRGSNCLLMQAMDGCRVRCGIISSCQSAATSEIIERFWSPVTRVSSDMAIASLIFTAVQVWRHLTRA